MITCPCCSRPAMTLWRKLALGFAAIVGGVLLMGLLQTFLVPLARSDP